MLPVCSEQPYSVIEPWTLQAKILRDPERPDEKGHPGGKSRGFGFVEFSDASHALAVLRQLNNNPTAFGSRDRCGGSAIVGTVCLCQAQAQWD
jgi:RNA recognition motif-containing protein